MKKITTLLLLVFTNVYFPTGQNIIYRKEIEVGGPDILSQNELAELTLKTWKEN